MMKKILFGMVLALPLLFSACDNDKAGNAPDTENTREIAFSLNSAGGGLVIGSRGSVSLTGMQWKLLCFDNDYNYLLEKTGTIGVTPVKVSLPRGVAYRFVLLCADTGVTLPELASGDDYWDLEAYAPQLPLAEPMNLLVSTGGEDGTLYVAPMTSQVAVTLSPRAVKVIAQHVDPMAAVIVNSITFSNAAQSAPLTNIEPRNYASYANLPLSFGRTTYTSATQSDGVCYILPDLYSSSTGAGAVVNVTVPGVGDKDVPVSLPMGMSLNMNAGKTYYIDIKTEAGVLSATWATRIAPKTLVIGSQNLWGKNSTAVIEQFNKMDVDVLCGQECSGFTDAQITAAGLYVHSHTNNGQGRVSIISRYPFSGVTANKYGVYIDLGDGITALVMNCHGINKPYGPYQFAGISYGGYGPNTNVAEVIQLNKDARQDMVTKLLEDFNASATPFVSLSGDFNEPSWLDWTMDAKTAGLVPYVVEWPTTKLLYDGGIDGDAYRTIHSNPVTHPGFTWTPVPAAQDTKDRIDLTLYAINAKTTVKKCEILGEAASTSDVVITPWVYDHRGLRTEFVYSK